MSYSSNSVVSLTANRLRKPLAVLVMVVATVQFSSGIAQAQATISFSDATETSIRGRNSESWGQSIGDLNNDGWPDIFVNNHRDRHSFYINNGDRTFTDHTLTVDKDSFIAGTYRTMDYHSGAFADIDDDGDTDLFVQWHGARSRSGDWCLFDCEDVTNSSLWLNEGDGRLVDYGEAWQMRPPGGSISGMLIDYDRDGDLDAVQGTLNSFILIPRVGPAQFGPTERVGNCARLYSVILSDLSGDGVADFTCLREGGFPDGIYAMTAFGLVDIQDTINLPPVNAVVDGVAADFDNDLDPDLFVVRGLSVPNDALQPTPNSIEAFLDSSINSELATMRFTTTGIIDIAISPYNKLPPKIWLGDSELELDVVRDRVFQLDPNDTRLHGFPSNRSNEVNLYGGYDPTTQQWQFMVYPGTRRYEPAYFTINSANTITGLEVDGLSESDGAMPPRLYRNDNTGFVNATWEAGFRTPLRCVSIAHADFDNDMDIDIYLVCKRGAANIVNRLFQNNGDGTFTEIPGAGGAGGPIGPALASASGWGDSATTGDFDNDGFIDLFVSNGLTTFPVRPDAGPHRIYYGEPNGNHWIELELVGTSSVANAQGARIIATSGGVSQLREQDSGYHRFSQNHDRIHFGLGTNTTTDLTITWPNGTVETFTDVAADKIYTVTEGSGIAQKTIGPAASFAGPDAGDECGLPYFESRLDQALLVWKDCNTGTWSVRASAGSEVQWSPQGRLSGSDPTGQDLVNVEPKSLETNDTITTQANALTFGFTTQGLDIDGFDFQIAGDAGFSAGSSRDWTVSTSFVTGWNSQTFDDSNWARATEIGDYGVAPWQMRVAGVPDSTPAAWIWSSDNANDNQVYLRYRVPDGVSGDATLIVTADNNHTTYLNGAVIGSGNLWTVASSFTVAITGGDVIAIEASDLGGVAGVLADISTTDSGNVGEVCLETDTDESVPVLLGNYHVPLKTPIALPSLLPCTPSTPATLSVQDITVNEADASATAVVNLSRPLTSDVSVKIFTRPASALGGQDFYGFTRTLSIAAGTTRATTTVTIINDNTVEADEQFLLRLVGAVNATIADAEAVVTIEDDDNNSTPTLSIGDLEVNESDGTATVTVSLSQASNQPVSVVIHTRSGTARGGTDFYGFTRNLTIAAGQTSTSTTVSLINDSVAESREDFSLRLIQPVNAGIADNEAIVTVIDDD